MTEVLVVYKKSVYELYSRSQDNELRNFMAENNTDVQHMKKSHDAQKQTLETIVAELERAGVHYEMIHRADLNQEKVNGKEFVISAGGDGTFLEVAHYVSAIPILGVNSDPSASTGFYCATDAAHFAETLRGMDCLPRTMLNRMTVSLNGEPIPELVLNDVLIAHPNPAAMTRYTITANEEKRDVRSSGLLVCTAAGSTAWMYQEGGDVMPLDSKMLQYLSRGIRGEKSSLAERLSIVSHARECKIYVDGQHLTYNVSIGSTIEMVAGQKLTVIGDLQRKRDAYTS